MTETGYDSTCHCVPSWMEANGIMQRGAPSRLGFDSVTIAPWLLFLIEKEEPQASWENGKQHPFSGY
jgi:hypothetical protein